MTNSFNSDDNSHIDDRINAAGAGAFTPRRPAPSNGTASAYSNDGGKRVSRSTVEHDGTISIHQEGPARAYASNAPNEGSPFTTIRNRNSTVTVNELNPESVVTLKTGETMSLRSAVNAGYVVQRPDGTYANGSGQSVPDSKKNPDEVKEEIHPDLVTEAFPLADRAADVALDELVSTVQPGLQLSTITDLIETGEVGAQNLEQLASQLGVDPEAVTGRLAPVIAAFKTQADAVVSSCGVDAEDVYSWARENCPAKLNDAMNKQATMRQTGGYKSIAQAYVLDLARSNPDAILNAEFGPGVEVRRIAATGQIVVKTRDFEGTWKSAVQAGIIKLG